MDRRNPVTPSPPATTALDAAVTARAAPGALPQRSSSVGGTRRLAPQLVVALLCAGYAIGSACGWGSYGLALVMGDFGLAAAAGTAAVSCVLYARDRRVRFRPAWLLFAFSQAMAALGNAVWGWYEVVLGERVPNPSYADLFFLCFAPPAIIGLLVLAKRPVTKAGWVCLALDAWLIGGSLLTLSWSLALAQAASFDGPSVAHTALSLAYPLLDIALVSMVLALHFRRSPINRTAVNTAIGGLALTVVSDAMFTSPLLHHTYRSGQLLDAGWFAGSLLLAYAPWVSRRTAPQAAERHDRDGHDAPRTALGTAGGPPRNHADEHAGNRTDEHARNRADEHAGDPAGGHGRNHTDGHPPHRGGTHPHGTDGRHAHRGQFLGHRAEQHRPAPARRQRLAQPHHQRQQRAGTRLETEHPGLRGGGLGGDAALGEIGEEVAAPAGRQLLLLPGLHQHHRQDPRRPLGGHTVHRRERAAHRQQHEPAPHRTAARAAAGHVHQDRAGRRRRVPVLAAQPLPHLQRTGALGAGTGRVQQPGVRRLQEHRVAGEVGEDAQHLRHSATAEQRLGAAAVHLLGALQQRVVAVDDLGVDLLGDRHERHLAVQLHQWQTRAAGGLHQRGRQPREARAQLHHQRGDAALGQGAHERPLVGGAGAQAVTGGQQQLTALEQGGDVGHLAGVHPAHRAAESVGAGEDLRQAAAQAGQLQGAADGDAGGLGVGCAVHESGRYLGGRTGNSAEKIPRDGTGAGRREEPRNSSGDGAGCRAPSPACVSLRTRRWPSASGPCRSAARG
ncbi:hypothetical protein GCM10010524_60240 [Streptomyces mexicanus]